mmetsp:Transcript_31566/g.35804  ORF Transcript_31566/g.35804 Transcript_31566/m.35804 type:complete len:189 (+) Transcript_31566:162-728(+)
MSSSSSSSSSSSRYQQFPVLVATILIASTTTTSVVDALSGQHWSQPQTQYNGGAGVGRLNIDDFAGKAGTWKCHYDMVLVERIQGNSGTEGNKMKGRGTPDDLAADVLFVPDDDLPRLHLCRILSIGKGREEENGLVAPNVDNFQKGDLVISKHPWGIGPKDEELFDGTKLSFMRIIDIAAKVNGEFN